jgi:hypothetical protein
MPFHNFHRSSFSVAFPLPLPFPSPPERSVQDMVSWCHLRQNYIIKKSKGKDDKLEDGGDM